MRFGTDALKGALKGSFNWRWVADVVFNGTRVLQDIPILSPRFTDSGSSLVQGTGTCTVVYQGDFAESIAPSNVGDLLAPFGTQLVVYVVVTVGDGFTERVQFGTYLIAETPSVITSRMVINDGVVSKGDRIDLTLKDLFSGVQADRFDTPAAASDLSSVWAEYQRLTQLPVTRSVQDTPIPASIAYQEDKLQACYDLAGVLDAVACLTADGTASMRPNVWPAPMDVLKSGDPDSAGIVLDVFQDTFTEMFSLTVPAVLDSDGTLIDVTPALANDSVYNAVVVRGQDPDGKQIVLATEEVLDGPLRVRNQDGSLSPYRRRPYFYSSDYITTNAQARAYAQQQLPRVSQLRSITVKLTEKFNPLREVGDVLTVNRLGDQFTCRVTDLDRDTSGTQTTTVVVQPEGA